jgi:hypothetical protein
MAGSDEGDAAAAISNSGIFNDLDGAFTPDFTSGLGGEKASYSLAAIARHS